MHVHAKVKQQPWALFFSSYQPCFLRLGLSLAWSKPQVSLCLHLPRLGQQAVVPGELTDVLMLAQQALHQMNCLHSPVRCPNDRDRKPMSLCNCTEADTKRGGFYYR